MNETQDFIDALKLAAKKEPADMVPALRFNVTGSAAAVLRFMELVGPDAMVRSDSFEDNSEPVYYSLGFAGHTPRTRTEIRVDGAAVLRPAR